MHIYLDIKHIKEERLGFCKRFINKVKEIKFYKGKKAGSKDYLVNRWLNREFGLIKRIKKKSC